MKITKLSLTNFRSFRATQHIEFAPLTLLFGPNSVGKSSVLMSLFYVQQILEKGQCDPVRLNALGEKHVGGFRHLVNARDIRKSIFIRIEASKCGEIGATYAQISDLVGDDFTLTTDSGSADADKLAAEFQISWSKVNDTAYIAGCKLWLDDELIAELSSDAGLKQPVISQLNFCHPALLDTLEDDGAELSRLQQLLVDAGYVQTDDSGSAPQMAIGFRGSVGALPPMGELLETVIDLDDSLLNVRVHEILSDAIVAPLDNILELLNQSLCIGPLRVVPNALYQPNPYPEQKDWYSGAAAWDVINKPSIDLGSINYWLNHKDMLNLGYSLGRKTEFCKVGFDTGKGDFSDLAKLLLAHNKGPDGLGFLSNDDGDSELAKNLKAYLQNTLTDDDIISSKEWDKVQQQMVLWDDVNNIEVSSADIGVGVSQLFPLVIAGVVNNRGLISCEQPELHVHPRVQVAIGDLLTQCRDNSGFLIETHSEHLILRVLRRIRETSDGELPDGLQPVNPEDIAVVYLEFFDSGVKAQRIHIDEDGEFIGRWPKGFFGERAEELF